MTTSWRRWWLRQCRSTPTPLSLVCETATRYTYRVPTVIGVLEFYRKGNTYAQIHWIPARDTTYRLVRLAMILFRYAPALSLFAAFLACTDLPYSHSIALENKFTSVYCAQLPHDEVCSKLPHDQTDFDSAFVYMLVEKGAQDPFDMFSWQTFVALNWPSDLLGRPLDVRIGKRPEAPRVWQSYSSAQEIFGKSDSDDPCGPMPPGERGNTVRINELRQASGEVLIDSDLNFVVYSTRINRDGLEYVRQHNLDTRRGQEDFRSAGDAVDFPQGYFDNKADGLGGRAGTISLKFAWKLLDTAANGDSSEYLTVNGKISVPASASASGEAMCVEAKLGLVGMHIVRRTLSGNGDEWLWSTFEHVDNAPVAANARDINSIYSHDLFPGGCKAPNSATKARYSFFNADCKECPTNAIARVDWRWASSAPYAKQYAVNGQFGTQVVRCWEIFSSTRAVNNLWHKKLPGTVWANYQLISTQWRGANIGPLFEHGEVPRFLTNTSMETFVQADKNGTCLGCHADALTTAGQNSNFSFLLNRAK